jgi:ferrous iron transport protein B
MIDLPGLYALSATNAEEKIAEQVLSRNSSDANSSHIDQAEFAIVVIDSTNLARNLFLTSEVRETGIPMLVLLNMADLARSEGVVLDPLALSKELNSPVIAISGRTGEGMEDFLKVLDQELTKLEIQKASSALNVVNNCGTCRGCSHSERYDWAEKLANGVTLSHRHLSLERTEKIDRYVTHPIMGLGIFALVMAGLFITLFTLAQYPMGWIEVLVGVVSDTLKSVIPEGLFQSLIVDGILAGVGGIIVFLPQICLLFFLLTLLEDTGYLSRAALVMDRLMKKVGLPGKAFVPMLSAHACAIPAIMASRVIEDRRDRLVTILVLPLLTCSARLPVYALVTAMLFANQPFYGGLVFFGAYALGIITALSVAFVLKKTFLKGDTKPILIELPSYKRPSLRNALLCSFDRGWIFIQDAGTTIMVISVILWGLLTFPRYEPEQLAQYMSNSDKIILTDLHAAKVESEQVKDEIERQDKLDELTGQIDSLYNKYGLEYSVGGRMGKLIEPVFAPLGFDWRIDIGVVSSFAAREVVVSTMSIIFGLGEDGGEDSATLASSLSSAKREDGTRLFNLPTTMSLFVFYILAMQCFPTQVITARETGHWKYAFYQFSYMTILAYCGALLAYQITWAITGI